MVRHYHLHLLLSDQLYWCVVALCLWLMWRVSHRPIIRAKWRLVFQRSQGMMAATVLLSFLMVCSLDSVHFRQERRGPLGSVVGVSLVSALDRLLDPMSVSTEKTYSSPLAVSSFLRTTFRTASGKTVRGYAPLAFAGHHNWARTRGWDIALRVGVSVLITVVVSVLLLSLWVGGMALFYRLTWRAYLKRFAAGKLVLAWRSFFLTVLVLMWVVLLCGMLALNYHVLGTNQIGQDILYETLKSIRTGVLIGLFTLLFVLPFALLLGTIAGYFGGWCDDIIQYGYTTLSSIPGVLLISAFILVLQVFMANHPQQFPTLVERADVRLLALCCILGLTSWSGLCRLLRAETLKLREQEFILAAKSLGVRPLRIVVRHVIPNVMHLVLIALVLDFSGLVLAEAVLSYVGIGVDPTMISWGNMINGARLELAREPVVWWPLVSAFVFMLGFVLSANLFADVVRDAFDPRAERRYVD